MTRLCIIWGILLVGCWSSVINAGSNATNLTGSLTLRFAERLEAHGVSRDRLELAYGRLCSPPLDDPEFVLADVHLNMNRRFTDYSGDISGRMLGALNAAGPIINRQTPILETIITGFLHYQKPDGHFGADQDLSRDIDQKRDMHILWGNGRALLAMAERCRQVPDARLLASAKRLGEYIISTRPYFGSKENFVSVGGPGASGFTTCYPSLIDGLVALGEVTGEKKFYKEAGFIANLSLLDSQFEEHHSHGRLTAYRGMLDFDRLTGKREFLGAVQAGCKRITDEFLLPTGGVGERFCFHRKRDEGCSEADWIRINLLLWQATGKHAYLDIAECALKNHVYATQFPNGGFGHRIFESFRYGQQSYIAGGITNVGSESYWCCSTHVTQMLADVARWAVVATDNKVLITWLAEVRSTITMGDRSVTVTVKRTEPCSWTVFLDAPKPTGVTLSLRVPGWADALTVNAQRYRAQGGWVDVRKLSGKRSLEITLPNHIRLAGVNALQPEEDKPMRVFAGPDLYCLPDVWIGDGLCANDAIPMITMAVKQPVYNEIPVILEGSGGKTQRAKLVPISLRPAGGCRYLFGVRRVDATTFENMASAVSPMPEPGTPVELNFACDGQCEIYFNGKRMRRLLEYVLAPHVRWEESPWIETYSNQASNVLAIKVRSESEQPGLIGMIHAGGRQHVTRLNGWSVVLCPQELPPDWLTDPDKGSSEAGKLIDLGGFGTPPWEHVPGIFAGSGAQWIWPAESAKQAKQWWLVRYRFDLDTPMGEQVSNNP